MGTKTAIDVLSSRQLYVQAQTNYAQAKYGYLNDLVALRVAAGNLDRATIAQINTWLVEPPATGEPATGARVPADSTVSAPADLSASISMRLGRPISTPWTMS